MKKKKYTAIFDQNNPNWVSKDAYNRMFLTVHQQWANDRFAAHGRLFLKDVYESLGLEIDFDILRVGWLKGIGDGNIDFGLTECDASGIILLDFNVDGDLRSLTHDLEDAND
jgi:hypothetical protein